MSQTLANQFLVVDDDRTFQLILEKEVQSEFPWGDIVVKKTAEEALDYFKEHHQKILVALIDHLLPGMSGLDLVSKINEVSKGTPTIMLTAYPSVPVCREFFTRGGGDFMSKQDVHLNIGDRIRYLLKSSKPEEKIGDQKENEEAKNLQTLIDASDDGLALLNSSFEIIALNKTFIDFVGKTRQEILGVELLKLLKVTERLATIQILDENHSIENQKGFEIEFIHHTDGKSFDLWFKKIRHNPGFRVKALIRRSLRSSA